MAKYQPTLKPAGVKIAKTPVAKKVAKSQPVSPKGDKKRQGAKEITEVGAKARFIRVAPRKVRLVINRLKGLEVERALNELQFMTKAAVRPVTKLLRSAIANAENNFNLERKDLFIKKFVADDGPILKRYQPRAHGRSAMIRKRTSHISLVLGIKAGAKPVIKKLTEKPTEQVKVVNPDEVKKSGPKSGGKMAQEQGKDSRGFMKGIFQRKTG